MYFKLIKDWNTTLLIKLNYICVQTKWYLEGITDGRNKPSEFRLSMEGALYPDRKGGKCRIKGHFHMSISFAPPPMLALVPPHVHRDITRAVFFTLSFFIPSIIRLFYLIITERYI